MSRWRPYLLPLACAAAGLLLNILISSTNTGTWNVDFNQYYAAGKLVGSGHLYDWDSIRALELERHSTAVPFGRIPVFAVVFRLLSALPYSLARALWLGAGIASLGGFLCLWPLSSRIWAFAAICWSAPIMMCLTKGQDTVLFLFFAALGLRLLITGHDFWAGIAFSACIAKPHLALLVPVLILAQARWKAMAGGIAGFSLSMVVSFAAEGADWPNRLLTLARTPEFDPAAIRMPNLRGLLAFTGGGLAVEIGVGVAIVAAIWLLSRSQPTSTMGALVLAGGLLLSHHSYFYDAELLLPALLLPFQLLHLEWLRKWALLLFTPVPYMFLLTDRGLVGHVAITGYTLVLFALLVIWKDKVRLKDAADTDDRSQIV